MNWRTIWWHGFSVGVWLTAVIVWTMVILFRFGVIGPAGHGP